jgi:hypothetical protein
MAICRTSGEASACDTLMTYGKKEGQVVLKATAHSKLSFDWGRRRLAVLS